MAAEKLLFKHIKMENSYLNCNDNSLNVLLNFWSNKCSLGESLGKIFIAYLKKKF